MNESPIYPGQIIPKAVTLARKQGREIDSSGTGPVLRRAEIDPFVIELSAIDGTDVKAKSIKVFIDNKKVFWAVFEHGWEEDADTKLLHWGPRQDWRADFMALSD